jgi:hypothetical protein
MYQYPREAWRPVLEGSFPAFEQELEHPAREWDLVEDLHLRLHHHIVSRWRVKEKNRLSVHPNLVILKLMSLKAKIYYEKHFFFFTSFGLENYKLFQS